MIEGKVLAAGNLSTCKGIAHGFFTREGGVSQGIYGSLNCGLGSDDDRDAVVENRRRAAAHVSAHAEAITTVYQVHSAEALIIDQPFAPDAVPKADALVTNTPGLAVGALAADCTPVLFADPDAGVVGAAHAGWRGAKAGILSSTVKAMTKLGADPDRIHAAIGPTIHQGNYEVGPEFEEQFVAENEDYRRFFKRASPEARPHFDLPGFCRLRLEDAGVGSIEDLGQCTYENESLFFSYRRKTHRGEADYGRQISAIVVA